MVDDNGYSDERIRSEASDTMRGGGDIREQVRRLTLAALKERRFDSATMRDVVRAVSEGIATGAERRSTLEMRSAFADALSGLDAALRTSAEAGYAALKQLSATGRTFSDTELKQALSSMRRIEEDFLGTVGPGRRQRQRAGAPAAARGAGADAPGRHRDRQAGRADHDRVHPALLAGVDRCDGDRAGSRGRDGRALRRARERHPHRRVGGAASGAASGARPRRLPPRRPSRRR